MSEMSKMSATRQILALLILLLLAPLQIAAQVTLEAQQEIDRLGRIDEERVAQYSDKAYTYDEEFFLEHEPATIFYPCQLVGEVPAVILVHGFNSSQSRFSKLAKHLASHGFIVLTYTALDQKRPLQWPPALIAAYQILLGESRREESPIYRHLDTEAIALIGHSMGGAGVLHTAMTPFPNGLGSKIKTVIALNPYNGGPLVAKVGGGENDELGCDLGKLTTPTLILTGSYDALAYPWKSVDFYTSLRGPAKRAFLSIDKMTHTNWYLMPGEPSYDVLRAICYCWLRAYLAEDKIYERYFEDKPGSPFFRYIHPFLGNSLNPLLPGSQTFPSYLIDN